MQITTIALKFLASVKKKRVLKTGAVFWPPRGASSLQPCPAPWNSLHQILGCSPQPPPCNTRLLLRLRFPGSLPRLPTYGLLLPSLAVLRSCLKRPLPVSLAFPLPPRLVSSSPRVSALYPKCLGEWVLSPVCLFANSWTESLDYLSLSLSLF